jgi:WD40 repeat protein
MALVPGEAINGRYRIESILGQGGMGRVWHARDLVLGRDVAVKELLLPADLPAGAKDELRDRALREAQALGRLNHPGIVTVHDVIGGADGPLIVMELVRGRSLAEMIRQDGPLPVPRSAEIGAAVLEALRAAHSKGIVHRDVKPGNVLIDDDRILLSDFGTALLKDDGFVSHGEAIIGSPAYMAPEQARRAQVTEAADLWALGATLYAAVDGRPPIRRPSLHAMIADLTSDRPVPRIRSAGPLWPVLLGLLQKDPARRITGAQAAILLEQVRRAADPQRDTVDLPHPPRRRRRWLFALPTVAIVAVAAFLALPSDGKQVHRMPALLLAEFALNNGKTFYPFSFSPTADGYAFANGRTAEIWKYTRRERDGDQKLEAERVATLTGHRQQIRGLVYDPTGRHLVTFGDDHTLRVWDAATGRPERTLPAPDGRGDPDDLRVNDARFGPDGTLISYDLGNLVRLWGATSVPLAQVTPPDEVLAITVLSATAGRIAAASETDFSVSLTDLGDSTAQATLTGHSDLLNTIVFSRDAKTVVTASEDKTTRIWDATDGTQKHVLRGRDEEGLENVVTVVFSPDEQRLATAGDLNASFARIWDVATGGQLAVFKGHKAWVRDIAFTSDGKGLATASDDETVKLWNAQEGGDALDTLSGHTSYVKAVRFSHDDRLLASVDGLGSVRIWNVSESFPG